MKLSTLMLGAVIATSVACEPAMAQDHHAGVVKRGAEVMGFDQAKTTHHFRLLPSGGVIEVTANDSSDAPTIAQIRAHLAHIATRFGQGNFSAPMLIHAQEPPGVADMKRAGEAISYRYESIDSGGRVRLESVRYTPAIHAFLRFQITDHRTGDPLDVALPQK